MDLSSCSKTRNPFTGAEANAVGVKVDHVSKSYAGTDVLKDVSFSVTPGEIFVIMGPSGSGKSVLLRHIAGLEVPSSGTITIDGKDPTLEATRDAVRAALDTGRALLGGQGKRLSFRRSHVTGSISEVH